MTPRRVLAFLLVPLVAGLSAFAWYSFRAAMLTHLAYAHGLSYATLGPMMSAVAFGRAGAFLLGGVAAALAGPHVAAAAGLALCASGIALVVVAPVDGQFNATLGLGFALTTIGSGVAVAAVWIAAVSAFARPLHGYRDALAFLLYAGVQAGANLAMAWAAGAGLVTTVGGRETLLFLAAIGAAGLGAVIAGGLAASHLALAPVPADDPTERLDARPVLLALGLAALALAPWTGFSTALDQTWTVAYSGGASVIPSGIIEAINPTLVVPFTLVAAVVAAGLAAAGYDLPTLPIVALGLLFSAVAAVLAAGAVPLSAWLAPVALTVLSGSEALITPLVVSRIGGDLHWRASALVVGAWLAATAVGSTATAALTTWAYGIDPTLPLLAAAAACSLGGLVLLAVAVPHHRLLRRVIDAPPPPDEE